MGAEDAARRTERRWNSFLRRVYSGDEIVAWFQLFEAEGMVLRENWKLVGLFVSLVEY